MRNILSISLFVCTLVLCSNGLCEVKQLDPGVINGWMRSAEMSNSDNTETKRIVHITTMSDWTRSTLSKHVRYEVTNLSCHRTLTFYSTDDQGQSLTPEWVELIEDHQKSGSTKIEPPAIYVRAYGSSEPSEVMKLVVEYQVEDGLPVMVVSDQRDVKRTLREFKKASRARIRLVAFENDYSFELDLTGFAEKADWSEKHCPLDDAEEDQEENVDGTEPRVES